MTITWHKFRWWRFAYSFAIGFLAYNLCGWTGVLIAILAQVDLEAEK